ncbi:hypothetical protein COCMIDRAFT_1003 [Bipolaris oryzae ATCC 44560]|uniref:NADH:flavin oxidoreductase/NADH oxidase N-terminal domain-containing protein n=1 Tax=Bipolaris oryzae ATCC 44560 TaxID=930090 RepID=W7A2Q8_COCMI|nr:uncharacterized protein COCMIDRAFT_1003 [Bipolaris oryzae ATCC 44560]EUC50281.1 hypothetical protein COCMIDRAFT_1003 [Bipolaris oryzae ATCC 44560]
MSADRLFQPLKVGNMELKHRVAMAPCTRFRASDGYEVIPLAAKYYAERACVSGTLIITEATLISKQAGGFANVPGIWSQAQVDAWKLVTRAVHEKGSYIYLQLWSLGRTADPKVAEKEGITIKSSSPVSLGEGFATPKEMTFLQDTCNKRTDSYGGSIENRSRFAVEVTQAVIEAIGAEKTGIRLSPFSSYFGMRMKDPLPQFIDIMKKMDALNLAFLHLVEPRVLGSDDVETTESVEPLLPHFTGPLILAGGFKLQNANEYVEKHKDRDIVIAFGRYFISTPDLVFRLQKGIEFNPYDRDTFYFPNEGENGYTDYPFSDEWKAEQAN